MTTLFANMGWRSKEPVQPKDVAIEDPQTPPADLENPSEYWALCAVEQEDPDLRDLNTALQTLVELFPDIQADVFREMLSSFSEESRVQIITEHLLKSRTQWVRGRVRVPGEQVKQQQAPGKGTRKEKLRVMDVTVRDTFRSSTYKEAVKRAFYQEFKGLSHSTIKAVLAEHNYSYTDARPTLIDLVSKSWRYSITSFLMRRKTPTAEKHPLVSWKCKDGEPNGRQSIALIPTKSAELNKELYDSLVVPIVEKQRVEQLQEDQTFAEKLNEEEAEELGELYDCECCFTSYTMDFMSACNTQGHFICYRCIRHSINEALYGQGWARNIHVERVSLKCIAPMTDNVDGCEGTIPTEFLEQALFSMPDGQSTLAKFYERAAGETLLKSRLPLIQCPFCSYAEVNEVDVDISRMKFRFRVGRKAAFTTLFLNLIWMSAVKVVLSFFLFFTFLLLASSSVLPASISLFSPIRSSLIRVNRKRRGLKFTCMAPDCGRSSCLSCQVEWQDVHACHESTLLSLRTSIERAMADAIKRTCPNCHLSFVKSAGCNKLTCVCGYQMCYICRQEIGKESYTHFCQHFRVNPGMPCSTCDKCDLYRTEDEDAVLKRAAEQAEREWREKMGEKGDEVLKWEERTAELGLRENKLDGLRGKSRLMSVSTWEWCLDFLVDSVMA